MASLRWLVKVPPTNKCQRVTKTWLRRCVRVRVRVCAVRCWTHLLRRTSLRKNVNFTQKGKLLYIFIL